MKSSQLRVMWKYFRCQCHNNNYSVMITDGKIVIESTVPMMQRQFTFAFSLSMLDSPLVVWERIIVVHVKREKVQIALPLSVSHDPRSLFPVWQIVNVSPQKNRDFHCRCQCRLIPHPRSPMIKYTQYHQKASDICIAVVSVA